TASRSDGAYDMAVNGGSPVVLVFSKSGLLGAERQVDAVWQEYAQVPDLILIPQDPAVTFVDLTNTSALHVARGSVTTDDFGSRQAAVFLPPGTQASLMMPDSSLQPVSVLHIRATEFTIGATGQRAMPAALPPTSAYTYAVDF